MSTVPKATLRKPCAFVIPRWHVCKGNRSLVEGSEYLACRASGSGVVGVAITDDVSNLDTGGKVRHAAGDRRRRA
ncbi:MAG TPA: hypothetical protein VIS71_01615 [Terrimicrobium sp.]